MLSYILRRVLHGVVSIIGASMLIFVISRMSGDPIVLLLPVDAPQSSIDAMRETMGLDRPIWIQYLIFAGKALTGDFGNSYRWQMPALNLVLDRLPATIELALSALLFSIMLAVPLGVLSAVHRGGWIDSFGKGFAMLGQAMPGFWVGLLLILVFSVYLNWLPAFGAGGISHLILPAIALGWYPVAAQTRIIRSAMLDVLDSDYIRMGRALGAPERLLVWKYAFRNAAVPLVTVLGVYFASMLGGAFVVEVIFAWPGLGRTVVEAVFARDFPVVQAGVLFTSVLFVVSNLLVDLSYGLIDPRIRMVDVDASYAAVARSPRHLMLRRLFGAGIPYWSLLIFGLVVIAAIGGDAITPHDPNGLDLGSAFKPPSWLEGGSINYLLGTDNLGRDIFSRIMAGASVTLTVAIYAIVISGGIGALIGMISGYFGGIVDTIIMRLVDIQMSIPSLALALVIATVLSPSLTTVVVVISITYWTWYARIIRGEILSLKERDYVALAKVAGCSTATIFVRHLLPNIVNTLLVLASLQVGQVIIFEASLSFLGLGIQSPNVSWGLMLADARNYIGNAWWAITLPGVAIMLTCLSANLIGDWLRDTLDPKRRQL